MFEALGLIPAAKNKEEKKRKARRHLGMSRS
jgi:hypothetical protein